MKVEGRRSNGSTVRVIIIGQTDGWTDSTKGIISLTSRADNYCNQPISMLLDNVALPGLVVENGKDCENKMW